MTGYVLECRCWCLYVVDSVVVCLGCVRPHRFDSSVYVAGKLCLLCAGEKKTSLECA